MRRRLVAVHRVTKASTHKELTIVHSFKQSAQKLLRRAGVYERLRSSHVYDLYWTIANRAVIEDRRKEVVFYRDILEGFRQGDLVFDIGANHGSKTDVLLRMGARVLAVEPDDVNQEILAQRFLRYRLTPKPVVILGKAVSDEGAVETMWVDEPGSAKNTLSRKWVDTLRKDESRFGHSLDFSGRKEVETTTVEHLMATYGVPFFIKIDVEGYEVAVLKGMKRAVPYLSFEVNLPEFRVEGLECIEQLARLASDGKFNYSADCRFGLALKRWLDPPEFRRVLNQCSDKSIEVFWRTSFSAHGQRS